MRTYELLCVDCAETLSIGKIVRSDDPATGVEWSTTGWRDLASGEWMTGEKQWRLVEKFFILHRCHELRVLPEILIDTIDPSGSAIKLIDESQEMLRRAVTPEPHPEEDRSRISSDAMEEIAQRIRKER